MASEAQHRKDKLESLLKSALASLEGPSYVNMIFSSAHEKRRSHEKLQRELQEVQSEIRHLRAAVGSLLRWAELH